MNAVFACVLDNTYTYLPYSANRQPLNFWGFHLSGQIIATSHDLTPNAGLVREIPLFQGNLGW